MINRHLQTSSRYETRDIYTRTYQNLDLINSDSGTAF